MLSIKIDLMRAGRMATALARGLVRAEMARADVVILPVKPQTMTDAVESIRSALDSNALVVSIAAGVTIGRLETALPAGQRVVRVMPNTPCLIGLGASGFALGTHATKEDAKLVASLL